MTFTTNNNLRVRPIAATGAALALGISALAGAAAPAQAEGSGSLPGAECPSMTALTDPIEPAKNAWTDKYGTSPRPFAGQAPAGGPTGGLEQTEPGSPIFKVQSPRNDGVGLGDARPGVYEVKIGDGVCGTTVTTRLNGNTLDLSTSPELKNAHGQMMVQIEGPLNPIPGSHNGGAFIDDAGNPTSIPDTQKGAVYYADQHAIVPVNIVQNAARNASTGLPVVEQGSTTIPLQLSDSAKINQRQNPPVTVTYRDAKDNKAQSHTIHAFLDGAPNGGKVLKGDELATLPSGRYGLTFDLPGGKQTVFVLVADGSDVDVQSLYAPAY